jgi:hypothetical protein
MIISEEVGASGADYSFSPLECSIIEVMLTQGSALPTFQPWKECILAEPQSQNLISTCSLDMTTLEVMNLV